MDVPDAARVEDAAPEPAEDEPEAECSSTRASSNKARSSRPRPTFEAASAVEVGCILRVFHTSSASFCAVVLSVSIAAPEVSAEVEWDDGDSAAPTTVVLFSAESPFPDWEVDTAHSWIQRTTKLPGQGYLGEERIFRQFGRPALAPPFSDVPSLSQLGTYACLFDTMGQEKKLSDSLGYDPPPLACVLPLELRQCCHPHACISLLKLQV